MSVELCLYCPETKHSVDVGANLCDTPRNTSESEWVISLFCAAHAHKDLIVTVIIDGDNIYWDEDTAIDNYKNLTGKNAPDSYASSITSTQE